MTVSSETGQPPPGQRDASSHLADRLISQVVVQSLRSPELPPGSPIAALLRESSDTVTGISPVSCCFLLGFFVSLPPLVSLRSPGQQLS